MNLSIETKLATALGAAFVALVLGAIAQTQNESGTAGLNEYALTDNATSIDPSRKEFQSSFNARHKAGRRENLVVE